MSTRHVEYLEKLKKWLPDMDLNHDKQIQSLLCYRYTIGQTDALENLKSLMSQSSRQNLHVSESTAGRGRKPLSDPPGQRNAARSRKS